jgi:hypothetical protein
MTLPELEAELRRMADAERNNAIAWPTLRDTFLSSARAYSHAADLLMRVVEE